MGEAKRRGTFEQRKQRAIDEGRVKRPTPKRPPARPLTVDEGLALASLILAKKSS